MKKWILTLAAISVIAMQSLTPLRGEETGELATTDMWDLLLDGALPTVENHDLYPDKLHQTQVWARYGYPDFYAINQHDIYITGDRIIIIYYGRLGYSQVVIRAPYRTYQ